MMNPGVRSVGLALLLSAISCAGRDTPSDEARGPTRRVVSLIPSVTEVIQALGAGDRLVARTDYDTDPALADLPSVGRGLTPSLERLTMLQPDLVVSWPDNISRSITTRLADLGIDVYTPEIQTLADMYETTRALGRRLGTEGAADSLVDGIRNELQALRAALEGRPPRTVFYIVWYDPPTTAGPGTYIHELIEIAGGTNAFADARALWPQVSLEEVVRRQPDMLIVPKGTGLDLDVKRLHTSVGWRDLRAVREGRIAEVDAELFGRPGPRVGEAARRLARILHPEAFEPAAIP